MSLRSLLRRLHRSGRTTTNTGPGSQRQRGPTEHLLAILEPRSFGHGLRGRVHRVNILTGGDTSVVLRFGIEEAERARFRPGTVLEVRIVEVPAPAPPAPTPPPGEVELQPVDLTPVFVPSATDLERAATDASYPCNCGAIDGRPHEPDCIWWQTRDALARQQRYDRILAEELERAGLPPADLLGGFCETQTVRDIHTTVVDRLDAEDRERRGE